MEGAAAVEGAAAAAGVLGGGGKLVQLWDTTSQAARQPGVEEGIGVKAGQCGLSAAKRLKQTRLS